MRYFERGKARIEIVPMIDIMLFLLVFFVMLTLKMIPATGVATQLPHSSTAAPVEHPKVMISLLEDGTTIVDGQPIGLGALTARLRAGDPAKTAVTIAGARNATVQRLMAVMDACRTAGIVQLALAAQQEP